MEEHPVKMNMVVALQEVTTPENINKVHDIVLQDRQITMRDIVEETGFSYHSVHYILEN